MISKSMNLELEIVIGLVLEGSEDSKTILS